MTKKVKDLTEEERSMICQKSECDKCPLSTKRYDDWGYLVTSCFKDMLEDEVEIPEEELK